MHPATIGPFQVLRELGRGGMGVVYLARDTKLDREVAIKALPESLAADPDRLARFQREAKVLASLNHPNIGAIYGLEEAAGHRYLILEYIEGETLSDRLKRGPIPIDEALPIAKQIAEALEAAHEKGVIHRDLKPGNVMVNAEGHAKVLDFGLARTAEGAPTSSSYSAAAVSDSPTVTSPMPVHSPTIAGVIMGTAGYMSPEQARGKAVDKRSDIFSFGCVLYEMLTGVMPFRGETVTDSLGATLHKDLNLGLLPAHTPPTVRLLLARCLAKDRANRLHDIADARLDLVQAINDPAGTVLGLSTAGPIPTPRRRGLRSLLPWALAAVAVIGGTFPLWSGRVGLARDKAAPTAPVVRFTIEPPPGHTIPEFIDEGAAFAISPAGDRIYFVAEADHKTHLCVREVSSGQSRVLPGTEGYFNPFLSPDGKWLGFLSGQKLMKMPAEGGPALTVCESSKGSTYAWLTDGTIVWAGGNAGLWRVSAAGGAPTLLAKSGPDVKTADGDMNVLGFDAPVAVPGADYVLSTVWDAGSIEDYHLVKVGLADGAVHTVLRTVTAPNLIAPDRLLFARGSTVMSVGFDPVRGVVVGDPSVALDGVRADLWADSLYMGASTGGTFAYVPGERQGAGRRLVRIDESGKVSPLFGGTDFYSYPPTVSPDGKKVLYTTLRNRIEVWVLDLERQSRTLVTSHGENYNPTWSIDSASIFTQLNVPNKESVIVRWPLGGGDPVALPKSCPVDQDVRPLQALPDGSGLLVSTTPRAATARYDIAVYRFADESLSPVCDRPANEKSGRLSPDGKWVAYSSDESGREEIYLSPLNASGQRLQVSTAGGSVCRFSRDGKRLFSLDPQQTMMAATMEASGSDVRVSTPVKLFDCRKAGMVVIGAYWIAFDVLPDGGFAAFEMADWEKQPPEIHVILNWPDELRAKGAGK